MSSVKKSKKSKTKVNNKASFPTAKGLVSKKRY